MGLIENIPFLSIMLCMVSGIISSALHGKKVKYFCYGIITIVGILSLILFLDLRVSEEIIVYKMGNFSAPWGNEIRASMLEAGMAIIFCMIMLFSVVGGRLFMEREVVESKHNLYYVLINLLLSSLLALIYTNDLFTAYVFVEINTISACGLIMIRQTGKTIEAATRYMIMSLLGSGLLLIGISILYDCTGHLLISNIQVEIAKLSQSGEYMLPIVIATALMSVGIAIKSALYPFHSWLPDAYGYSSVGAASILSSLVSKGYIFLLIKIFYRVIGIEMVNGGKIIDILFVFGLVGMIMGSISAMHENDIRRMIAFSSVAQIGYIYMGIGLGTKIGMVASLFHIITHGITKALLFISVAGLTDAAGTSRRFIDLTGAAYRNKVAGVAFTVGSLSMVGIPMLSGFISKLLFSQAAIENDGKMLPTLIVLAISTIFNAIYFLKTVIRIYTPVASDFETKKFSQQKAYAIALIAFSILNVVIGMLSQPIVDSISKGLDLFS